MYEKLSDYITVQCLYKSLSARHQNVTDIQTLLSARSETTKSFPTNASLLLRRARGRKRARERERVIPRSIKCPVCLSLLGRTLHQYSYTFFILMTQIPRCKSIVAPTCTRMSVHESAPQASECVIAETNETGYNEDLQTIKSIGRRAISFPLSLLFVQPPAIRHSGRYVNGYRIMVW